MKLSPAQTRTLAKMKSGEGYYPWHLSESTATLRALERKGMIEGRFDRFAYYTYYLKVEAEK